MWIWYIMYISKNRYGKHAYWNVLSFVSMRWRCPGIVYDQMLYRSKTYSTDPCNIPRTLAPTCLWSGLFGNPFISWILGYFRVCWPEVCWNFLRVGQSKFQELERWWISNYAAWDNDFRVLLSLKDDFLSMNFFKGNLEEYSCLVGDSGSMFLALLSSNVASTHMMWSKWLAKSRCDNPVPGLTRFNKA